jgi:uncharacterized DUF497 family protein
VEFDYDQNKSERNHAKHGLDFEQAKVLWSDPKRVEFVARFSDEPRLGLVGKLGDKLWTAIFTTRENRTRLISVRRAREHEEALYNNSRGV